MRIASIKIKIMLFMYSILMTACLLAGLYVFVNYSQPKNLPNQHQVLFYADNDSLLKGVANGEVNVRIDSSVTILELDAYYKAQFMRYLPVAGITIVFFVFISASILWLLLSAINKRQIAMISNRLRLMEDHIGFEIVGEPLERVYQGMMDTFEHHFDDYKRLNSYITHEQKNALSLLRVKLEMRGERELIKNIDAISSRIDDILTISQSKGNIHLSFVDVALVCAQACDEYKKIYPSIVYCFDEEESNIVAGKEVWLYRAVCNLLDNAIKYGEQSQVVVCVTNKHDSVILTVSDQGIGIDMEFIEEVFKDGFRVSTLKKDGYGIGLSLVRHVCDLCGGLYYVDSQIGRGSTFYMVFPAEKV